MFEILDQSTSNCIGVRVTGKVAGADYGTLVERLDEAIEAYGDVNMLVQVEDLRGVEDWDAVKADFDFGFGPYRNVGRCAFVSDKKWHKWIIKIMDPFTRRTEERYFESSEIDQAWTWALEEA